MGSGMLGDVSVRRKVVTSAAIAQADAFQWTVIFLSKVISPSEGNAMPRTRQDV